MAECEHCDKTLRRIESGNVGDPGFGSTGFSRPIRMVDVTHTPDLCSRNLLKQLADPEREEAS